MNTLTTPSSDIIKTAETLRWQIGQNFHEQLLEDIYTNAARLADRAVTRPSAKPRFDLDRTIDHLVTSRIWGFPLMILLFALVFWLTIVGANYPSQSLAFILVETIYPWLQEVDRLDQPSACPGGCPGCLSMACTWLPPGSSVSCCRQWLSSSRCLHCWRISATCHAWPLTWTMSLKNQGHTANNR